jgi:ABC-type methionine transport system permease subunit
MEILDFFFTAVRNYLLGIRFGMQVEHTHVVEHTHMVEHTHVRIQILCGFPFMISTVNVHPLPDNIQQTGLVRLKTVVKLQS